LAVGTSRLEGGRLQPAINQRQPATGCVTGKLRCWAAFAQRQHRLIASEEKRIPTAAREEAHAAVALPLIELKAQRQLAVSRDQPALARLGSGRAADSRVAQEAGRRYHNCSKR
jgi:hypothetical protein